MLNSREGLVPIVPFLRLSSTEVPVSPLSRASAPYIDVSPALDDQLIGLGRRISDDEFDIRKRLPSASDGSNTPDMQVSPVLSAQPTRKPTLTEPVANPAVSRLRPSSSSTAGRTPVPCFIGVLVLMLRSPQRRRWTRGFCSAEFRFVA